MGVVENARFSEFLRGKEGLESVYQLIQAEMKLLEQMELYIEKRAVIDIEYAEKLAKLHEKVKLGESNVYTDGSLIEKVINCFNIYIYIRKKLSTMCTLPTICKLLQFLYFKRICVYNWNLNQF